MKILILCATGRAGKLVLEQALKEGYRVNCLVRNPEKVKLQSESLTVFKGDTTYAEDLEKEIKDFEAVISTLNISRGSDFRWAPLRTSTDFLSNTMTQLVDVAQRYPTKRIIVCSAWGMAETKSNLHKWFKWFIDNSNIGIAYKDQESQEAILTKSDLDWTIIRPTGLTNSRKPNL